MSSSPPGVTVLCCRAEDGPLAGGEPGDGNDDRAALSAIVEACAGLPVHWVGRRPKKSIDPLLEGRILVVGDDSDLNAVALRLLRKDLLGDVQVAFAAVRPTAVTKLYGLPAGPAAVSLALRGDVDLVPLVRTDAGGVLVGSARLSPVAGTVYVDENRVLAGRAPQVVVEPDAAKGVAVTVIRKRILGFGRRFATTLGRAVEFGLAGETEIVYDGIRHPRNMQRWVFYKHTAPLRLVRGLL